MRRPSRAREGIVNVVFSFARSIVRRGGVAKQDFDDTKGLLDGLDWVRLDRATFERTDDGYELSTSAFRGGPLRVFCDMKRGSPSSE
jgi:hypothetical protein